MKVAKEIILQSDIIKLWICDKTDKFGQKQIGNETSAHYLKASPTKTQSVEVEKKNDLYWMFLSKKDIYVNIYGITLFGLTFSQINHPYTEVNTSAFWYCKIKHLLESYSNHEIVWIN